MGQILGLQRPGRVVRWQAVGRFAPPLLDGRSGGEAFQTVTVEGAAAGIGVARGIVGYSQVSHLGVDQAVHRAAVDQAATADAGADGEIDEGRQAGGRAPAPFGDGGGVDVGIEGYRPRQFALHRAGEVDVRPPFLRGGGDVTEGGRVGSQVNGSKRCDAHAGQGVRALQVRSEELEGATDRFLGCRGREADLGPDILGADADGADELRSSRLDAAYKLGHFRSLSSPDVDPKCAVSTRSIRVSKRSPTGRSRGRPRRIAPP